jgi:hypothetical protein
MAAPAVDADADLHLSAPMISMRPHLDKRKVVYLKLKTCR